ncbi:relaxase/mobilization nuclease domain-containing protein [Aliivibrio salmonicida]|uniref:relaxase/mobilization nuclease domain-containing protein n=1 Tax=Aliivibrio salmonicida TaxID=40269 RepID=UPI00406D416F
MIVRVGGGHGGIAEYLEYGMKQDRHHSRDELDQRVILEGDLTITNQLINSIETKTPTTERYLHITLAFKEDHISNETLNEITQEFKSFAMSAYQSNEYDFYAEAHIPKIKSLVDKRTGELVERKPHIHIVIPKINLETGKRLTPFEMIEIDKKYIDAFQEVTNEKYNLASPKIHVRQQFTDGSELISRTKGDEFHGAHRGVKADIVDRILDKNITSMHDFKADLISQGWEVKVRNQGKENEYLNIKKPSDKKGINLKDNVFQSQFLALSPDKKNEALTPTRSRYSESHQDNYKASQQAHTDLKVWEETRSYEVRFLHSGNRASYRNLSVQDKQDFLIQKMANVAQHKLQEPKLSSVEQIQRNTEQIQQILERSSSQLVEVKQKLAEIQPEKIQKIMRERAQGKALIQALRLVLKDHGKEPLMPLQKVSNINSQSQSNSIEKGNADISKQEVTVIKKHLNAEKLLDSLSRSHGLNKEKYSVTKSEAGDRIKCGSRNLNVSDFLTKEINLSWKETKDVLSKESQQQRLEISLSQMKTVIRDMNNKIEPGRDIEYSKKERSEQENIPCGHTHKSIEKRTEREQAYAKLIAQGLDKERANSYLNREEAFKKSLENMSPEKKQELIESGQKIEAEYRVKNEVKEPEKEITKNEYER